VPHVCLSGRHERTMHRVRHLLRDQDGLNHTGCGRLFGRPPPSRRA
jgi:hypothetical protein